MDNLEISGKTVDEAIAKALKQLGLEREDINVTVIDEGKSGGLFGPVPSAETSPLTSTTDHPEGGA